MRDLQHGQGSSTVKLAGLAGQILELKGTAEDYYEWQADDRRALDLELRARIVGTTATLGTTPLVRYRLELGHGAMVYNLPPGAFQVISGTPQPRPALPARGLVLRLSGRVVRFFCQGGTNLAGGAVALNQIQVSVQPSSGERFGAADWHTQYVAPPPALSTAFPMGSREFRVRQPFTGEPFAIGATSVIFVSLAGQLWGPLDASTVWDWTPIPVHAATLTPGAAMQVDFR